MTLTLEEALAPLSEDSLFRSVIRALVTRDPRERMRLASALASVRRPYWEAPLLHDEAVVLAVLRAVLEMEVPLAARDVASDLILALTGSATPTVIELVEAHYERQPSHLRRDLLALVASAGTSQAASSLVGLVARHGWPARMTPRFFYELGRCLDHADVLFPELLVGEGASMADLLDVVLGALRLGTLSPSRLGSDPSVRMRVERIDVLSRELDAACSSEEGVFGQAAFHAASELAIAVDLAGFVGDGSTVQALHRVARGPTGTESVRGAVLRPAAFAIASLLRRGESPDDESIERVAADALVRPTLHSLLVGLGEASRIPPRHRTRDAFAESDMVGWLAHPSEMGRPPAVIERMAVYEARLNDEDLVLYLWRFQSEEGGFRASTSGPYPAIPPEGSLSGTHTFSRFDDWDALTPEGHVQAMVENLADWRRAWARRDGLEG